MAWLATPLAATAFALQGRLESLAIAGGWFGRVATDAHPQAGQLGSQCGELLPTLRILLTRHKEILTLLPLVTYLLLLS